MIERTGDASYIKAIATHPRVWPWISEDEDRPEDYEPDMRRTAYVRVPGGYLSFRPFTRSCWEVHICMLPKTRDVKEKTKAALDMMRAHGIASFLAKIPAPNRHALKLAESLGFVECGRVPKCVHRGGEMVDFVLMRG